MTIIECMIDDNFILQRDSNYIQLNVSQKLEVDASFIRASITSSLITMDAAGSSRGASCGIGYSGADVSGLDG